MNELKIISSNGELVTESREVAEMVDQQHKELLRTIRSYIGVLTGASLRSSDFFIPHTYQDAKKEVRPCFLLTRKGCDMVANKMTGDKGVLFTAAYVSQFERMEKELSSPRPLTEKEQLKASMRLSLETSEEVEAIKVDVAQLKDKVDNQMTLDYGMQRRLQRAVGARVYEIESEDQARRKLFRELYREIKDRFGVASYKDVLRKDLQSAIYYVEAWIPKRIA
ncbi:phage regulatory protein [Sporosarcina sp. P12(2017)]|uniref:Rha family transcriptional regulator n=1 Tax=unclassified Sporosarcina TaxID=2647733 RepID=UPI000C1694CB|nr:MULTISPECIES: Rha family transcriptional regulator [unclassified Sporosarcina]PIC59070.1 phage regulatory protein [Sporosarcina sp. P10]PIC62391.1 phage regulatory protein [Sporosarcina sp. P12(2017)]